MASGIWQCSASGCGGYWTQEQQSLIWQCSASGCGGYRTQEQQSLIWQCSASGCGGYRTQEQQSLITSLMALVSELYVVLLLTHVVKMSKN